jgi:2-oxoglutarate dehydrogenase E2 component (dihydrolipoamide succinyltransferase)
MAIVDLIMPKMGESIMEATVLKWHKQPGDQVKLDETVLEIATDKVDTEVPSTAEGIIEQILYNVNDVVPVGSVIARIKTEVEEGTRDKGQDTRYREHEAVEDAKYKEEGTTETVLQSQATRNYKPQTTNSNGRFYSPLVLNIAASEGVSMTELETIPGTGNEGRVTKKDILQYVSQRKSGVLSRKSAVNSRSQRTPSDESAAFVHDESVYETPSLTTHHGPLTAYSGNVEIIEMDRMRKLIAEHMVRSKHTSAHVTSFTEADVTNIVMWREKVKKEFEKREGTKITFTPLFIETVVHCKKSSH